MKHYDVLHIGNYTKDTIINKGVTSYVDGGGFNYGARATVTFMDQVAILTKLSPQDSRVIDELKSHGIDTYPIYGEHSTNLTMDYQTDNPDERVMTITEQADAFTIDDLDGLEADAYVLAPSIKGEVPQEFIEHLAKTGALVAIDAQGFIRILDDTRVVYTPWVEAPEIFPLVSLLKVDIAEAEFITGLSDRYQAIYKLHEMGAKETILTYRDGVMVFDGNNLYEQKFKQNNLSGRSGRGDTCISTYAASRLTKNPEQALLWTAALTTLKLEKHGPFTGTADDVEKVIIERY
jgi:sugar/nucleoside kinase (ribokinase family)